MLMVFLSFFSWWYVRGWQEVALSIQPRSTAVLEAFSVKLLLPTLFAPWKRITTNPGRSLGDKMHAWADNMFSRAVGFVVRIGVLIAAGVTLVVVLVMTVVELILWPLLPVAVPALIVIGLVR